MYLGQSDDIEGWNVRIDDSNHAVLAVIALTAVVPDWLCVVNDERV